MMKQNRYGLLYVLLIIGLRLSFTTVQAEQEQIQPPPITVDNAAQVFPAAYLSRGSVQRLLWSPTGKILAVSSSLGTWLYDTSDFKKPPRLLANNHNIMALAFSPDGTLLVSSDAPNPYRITGTQCFNATVHVWDVATGTERFAFSTTFDFANTIAFSPDNAYLAVASSYNQVIQLWNLQTGQMESTLDQDIGTVFGLAFSPDGLSLLSVGGNNKIYNWNMKSKSLRKIFSTNNTLILDITYSQDSRQILISYINGNNQTSYQILAADTGTLLKIFANTNVDNKLRPMVAFSADGQWLVAGNQLIQKTTNQSVTLSDEISSSFSPDGKYLAWATTGTIQLRNLKTGIDNPLWSDYSATVSSLMFSADGKSVVSTDSTDIRLWDFDHSTIKQHIVIPNPYATAVAISPDFKIAASIVRNKLQLWNAVNGTKRFELTIPVADSEGQGFGDFMATLDNLTFTPDGKLLAFASRYDHQIRLLDPQTNRVIATLAPNGDHTSGLAFTADGTILVALNGNPFNIYSVKMGELLRSYSYPMPPKNGNFVISLAVSPSGQLVAGGSWQQITLWNESAGQLPVVYPTTLGMVNRLAFNPDGTILAAAVNTYYGNPHECWGPLYHVIELWDTQHNHRLTVLDGHYNMLTALAFSPDGRWLLTGYDDGVIEIWDVNPGAHVF